MRIQVTFQTIIEYDQDFDLDDELVLADVVKDARKQVYGLAGQTEWRAEELEP